MVSRADAKGAPLFLDLGDVLTIMPADSFTYTLKHGDINVVWTDLAPADVGKIHSEKLETGFGENFDEALAEATTVEVDSEGVVVPTGFLTKITDEGKGVLLLEGRSVSSEPFVIEVTSQGSSETALRIEFPLSLSGVRSMLRVVNLREIDPKFAGAGLGPSEWKTDTSEPAEYPDGYYSLDPDAPLKTVVHIHGFNWGADEVPAAHAEMFKRFFQAGSNARFVGVSWRSQEGSLPLVGTTLDYNENVINAFITARYLSNELSGFTGSDTVIFAHSLGNIVASSAIIDYGLKVGEYFMVSSSVPLEAYDGEQDLSSRRKLVHKDDWLDQAGGADYAERFLSPNWYQLFFEGHQVLDEDGDTIFTVEEGDRRTDLRWKGRFSNFPAGVELTNFYSMGEEVLAKSEGVMPNLISDVAWRELRVWVYNEMNKGRSIWFNLTAILSGDSHGGWGFNGHHYDFEHDPGPGGPGPGDHYFERKTPAEADLIQNYELILEPFFTPFKDSDSDFPAWGNGEWLYGDTATANSHLPVLPVTGDSLDQFKNHAKILAEAIPAHSDALGGSEAEVFGDNNIDLNSALYRDPSLLPQSRLSDGNSFNDGWLHSDYIDPAYPYVWKLYEKLVEEGNLSQ